MANFDSLDKIFQIITPQDFKGRIVAPSNAISEGPEKTNTLMLWILEKIINIDGNGVLSASDVLDQYKQLVTQSDGEFAVDDPKFVSKLFRFHTTYGSGWPEKIPDVYKESIDPDGNEVAVTTMQNVIGINSDESKIIPDSIYSNIFCGSPVISPATRNAQVVSLFMNSIPSHIMSLCVPKLEVNFTFNRLALADKNPSLYPGTLKFLLGAKQYENLGDMDKAIARGHGALQTNSDGETRIPSMGIDAFLGPQTMINMDNTVSSAERYNKVIDPTRPFATITGMTVNVIPQRGFMTFKKATLNITLHDRSRLAELADIIKPDNYPSTTVWIEYGWSFPSDIDKFGFGYGDLIRKMRSPREAYGVKNSSFSFTDNGEVQIVLELFTKGKMANKKFKITDGDSSDAKSGKNSIHGTLEAIRQLTESIRVIRRDLNLYPVGAGSKEVRAFQLLDAAEQGVLPDLSSSEFKKALADVKQMVSVFASDISPKGKTVGQMDIREKSRALLDALERTYTVDSSGGGTPRISFKETSESKIKNALESQFSKALSGFDPYLPTEETPWFNDKKHPFANTVEDYDKNKERYYTNRQISTSNEGRETVKDFPAKNYKLVSFAKLITSFLAKPLLTTGSEVQCLFYMFNNQAGNAASCNIGEFPVEMPILLDNYRSYVLSSGNANVSLEAFIQIAITSSLNDPRGIGYGMRSYYEPYKSTDKHAQLRKSKEKDYESTVSEMSKKLGGYVPPVIDVFIETLQKRPTGEETSSSQQIIRIHFYDKAASPYRDAEIVLRGQDGKGLYTIPTDKYQKAIAGYGTLTSVAQNTPEEPASRQILAANDKKLQENADAFERDYANGDSSLSNASPEKFKELISRTIPTIKYGSSNTAILSADVQTKSDDLMATTFMLSSFGGGKGSAIEPNGAGKGGIPLMTIPAQLSVTTYGCPLLHPVQQYFFDFSTGTTIDNIYVLTNLTHDFQPGEFSSNATFTFYDAYGRYYGAQTTIDQLRFELQKVVNQEES